MSQKKGKKQTWDIKKASKTELVITRILLIILGILLLLIGLYFIILLPLAILCFYLAHVYKKELNERKNPPVETIKEVTDVREAVRETVKVTDIDGSEKYLSIHLSLDQSDRVLMAKGGRAYHTHLSCFKNWRPEMIENFTGWKIIKKSEAIANGMSYCNFCKDLDRQLDDDFDEYEE